MKSSGGQGLGSALGQGQGQGLASSECTINGATPCITSSTMFQSLIGAGVGVGFGVGVAVGYDSNNGSDYLYDQSTTTTTTPGFSTSSSPSPSSSDAWLFNTLATPGQGLVLIVDQVTPLALRMKNHTWVTVQGRGFLNTTRCVLNNQYTVDATVTYLLSTTTLQVILPPSPQPQPTHTVTIIHQDTYQLATLLFPNMYINPFISYHVLIPLSLTFILFLCLSPSLQCLVPPITTLNTWGVSLALKDDVTGALSINTGTLPTTNYTPLTPQPYPLNTYTALT